MTGGEESRSVGAPKRRAIVYCLVPSELAERVHDPLRR